MNFKTNFHFTNIHSDFTVLQIYLFQLKNRLGIAEGIMRDSDLLERPWSHIGKKSFEKWFQRGCFWASDSKFDSGNFCFKNGKTLPQAGCSSNLCLVLHYEIKYFITVVWIQNVTVDFFRESRNIIFVFFFAIFRCNLFTKRKFFY